MDEPKQQSIELIPLSGDNDEIKISIHPLEEGLRKASKLSPKGEGRLSPKGGGLSPKGGGGLSPKGGDGLSPKGGSGEEEKKRFVRHGTNSLLKLLRAHSASIISVLDDFTGYDRQLTRPAFGMIDEPDEKFHSHSQSILVQPPPITEDELRTSLKAVNEPASQVTIPESESLKPKEKFILPELDCWTKLSIKLFRSKVPSSLTYHHIWWVIHLTITGVLLWLYYTQRAVVPAATMAVIELQIGVAVRSEILIAILHYLFVFIPIGKRFFNRMLHCIGGIHTSAAFCAIIWLTISLVRETQNYINLITGYILLVLIIALSAAALPPLRRKYHNSFEYLHRFVGWTGLVMLIVHIVLLLIETQKLTVIEAFSQASVIMVIIVFFIIFLPWILVRKVKVSWTQPSTNLTVATFAGLHNPYGSVSRISFNGIEWHAFAIAISDPEKRTHALVIAKVGDWTTKVSDGCAQGTLPTEIWVRNMKSIGFMYSIQAYKKVLVVCTGSGIAPALPYIKNPVPSTLTHILWIAKKHKQVFGEFFMNLIEKTAPHYTLHDTAIHGRPSVEVVIEWYYRIKADAVFIVSNEPFTDQIVNGCWENAIPAFGALFDS